MFRKFKRLLLVALLLPLTACDTQVDVNLTANPKDDLTSVEVPIKGVAFYDDDDDDHHVYFDSSESIDLMDYQDDTMYAMFTSESLDEGTYEGVQLVLGANDGTATRESGAQYDIVMGDDSDVADLDFKLSESSNTQVTVNLAVDLRLSLTYSAADKEYTFNPVIRATTDDDGASVTGTVDEDLIDTSSCTADDRDVGEGVAIYVFKGEDQEPDDYDGEDNDPIATGPVTANSSGTGYDYTISVLPAGDYTLALTCLADDDDPDDDDTLDFVDTKNVDLSEGETATKDFD